MMTPAERGIEAAKTDHAVTQHEASIHADRPSVKASLFGESKIGTFATAGKISAVEEISETKELAMKYAEKWAHDNPQ